MAKTISMTELRNDMSRALAKVELTGQRFVVVDYGKRRAALVPLEDLEQLERKPRKQKKKPK